MTEIPGDLLGKEKIVALIGRSKFALIMQMVRISVLAAAMGSTSLLSGRATAQPAPATNAATPARITVLYDAFGKDAAMTKDWVTPRSSKSTASASFSIPATTRRSLPGM